jgi:F0F1-type ATP synthase delta subunit
VSKQFKCNRWVEAFVDAASKLPSLSSTSSPLLPLSASSAAASVSLGLEALEVLVAGLKGLQRVLKGSSDAAMLNSALKKTLQAVPQDLHLEYARRLLVLLVTYGYWEELPRFMAALRAKLEALQGIIRVELYTAQPVDEAFLGNLEKELCVKTGARQVLLRVTQRPELIGGYCIRLNNELFDLSLREQLKRLGEAIK